jgi:NADH-quinone oxidoreductase subunit C
VTSNQSEETVEDSPEAEAPPEASAFQRWAEEIAHGVGGTAEFNFDTAKVRVEPGQWTETLTKAKDEHGLAFFSWLSAIDWTNEQAMGEKLSAPTEERYEILAAVGDLDQGNLVIFSTDIAKEDPRVDSLVSIYPGANWHEREAAEMFGIDFAGHPELEKLYLPDGFQGFPLRKSFPLLSREVKPWPGTVDVEGMPGKADDDEPSEENPEA